MFKLSCERHDSFLPLAESGMPAAGSIPLPGFVKNRTNIKNI